MKEDVYWFSVTLSSGMPELATRKNERGLKTVLLLMGDAVPQTP